MKGRPFGNTVLRILFILWGAASLSGVDLSPDRGKIEPFLLATDQPAVAAAQRKMMDTAAHPDRLVPVFIHMKSDDPDLPAKLGNLGGGGRQIHSRLFTGRIPRDAARYISNWDQVAYIESAKRARPLLDRSAPAVSADIVHAGTGLPSPFTGTGTYVGIVDTGLDDSHLDFHTGGLGSPHRIVHWYPSEATAGSDFEGHGTHAAGIAAGNGFLSSGAYAGMAPGADLLAGKTTFLTSDILLAVQDLVSFAQTNSRPVSVNLSLGLMLGPHDGTSGFESGLNSIAANSAGIPRLIAAAAGNERGRNEHFQANLPPFGTVTIPMALANDSSVTVTLWADGNDRFLVGADMGSEAVSVPSGSSGSSPGGRISISNKVSSPPNGATFISVFFNPSPGTGSAAIRLERTRNGGTGRVDAYVEGTEGSFGGATDSGTISEPANGSAVIAVGSFDTKTPSGGIPAQPQKISDFSSRGPTRDGRQKPDITAPGAVIYAARSFDQSPVFDLLVPGNSNYFVMEGTSMSTPHVTGIAALAWQSNPSLTGAQMRERIRRTANLPTDGTTPPNAAWGYGKVNALGAVRNSVASITAPETASPGSAVTMTSENSSGAFGDPLTSYRWSLAQQPAGSSLSLSSTAPSASFTPVVPGDYSVALTVSQAEPPLTPPGTATAVVRVNHVPPLPSITGPSATDNLAPVTFTGTGTDPDGQQLVFHWVLVSRPAGSAADLSTADATDVTLAPDAPGTYEVGLKVDDRLDNSALAIRSFTTTRTLPPSTGGGGGGGGCAIAGSDGPADPLSACASSLLLLLPACALAARRKRGRSGAVSPAPSPPEKRSNTMSRIRI
jgi:subtilisin family serine protease